MSYVLILQFAGGMVCDVYAGDDPLGGIADFIGQVMRKSGRPDLPLLSTHYYSLDDEAIEKLTGIERPAPPVADPPSLPMAGLHAAMKRYLQVAAGGAEAATEIVEEQDILAAFFNHHGIRLDLKR